MSLPRFFVPGAASNETPRLVEGAARHATSVLRLRAGDSLRIFDAGREFEATVLDVGRRDVSLHRGSETSPAAEPPVSLHLITSPLKGDLTEQVIRQTTELGVARITIARFERTDAVGRAHDVAARIERWTRVLVSAVEQCGRASVPALETVETLAERLATLPQEPQSDEARFVAREPSHGPAERRGAGSQSEAVRTVRVVVGPAGGLTPAELEVLSRSGFSPLSLGTRTLRAETACVAAVAVLLSRFGDAC